MYIDEDETPAAVHFFNFKYTDHFKKTTNNFPSSEIDKICNFISSVMQQDDDLAETINGPLFSKVKDIWNLFLSQNPQITIHICSNTYEGFEEDQRKRFEREIGKFSNFTIQYHLMPYFVDSLTKKGKQQVNARIRAIDKNLFEKSDGDIRALIVDLDAKDLLRIVMNNESIRQNVDFDDYATLPKYGVLEDAFEDNVRVYLKQRSKINRNIKETALSEDAHRFFYFNNGITITCSHFDYPKQRRSPIIELHDLQVVNGSQTIHALFDAFKENQDGFDNMDVLCRVYETRNKTLSTDIAEYTNSQNPVKSRDIRSNDFVQKKLEKELEALGFYYERKKGQYAGKPKNKRIDSEKAGQALMAFFNEMPAEAKNRRRIIFAEQYDDIFTEQVTADSILLIMRLFVEIEKRKRAAKRKILANMKHYEEESYILHASYYLLYLLGKLADLRNILKTNSEYSKIIAGYEDAVQLIMQAINLEKENLKGYRESYTHRMFFISNRPKIHLEDLRRKVSIQSS